MHAGPCTCVQSTIWFANQTEVDLFHAVVSDLRVGKHPGNRISVPLIRQATIMKRNRAGFYSIRHAVRLSIMVAAVSAPTLLACSCNSSSTLKNIYAHQMARTGVKH